MARIGDKEAQIAALRKSRSTKPAAVSPLVKPKPPAPVAPPADQPTTTRRRAEGAPENTLPKQENATMKRPKATKAKARTSAKKPAKTSSGERRRYDWKGAEEKAKAGTIPAPPNFSAPTHEPWRTLITEVIDAAKAKDRDSLKKIEIKPTSSTPKALDRFRKLCLTALAA